MQGNSHDSDAVAEYDPETGTYTVNYHETSDIELSVTVVHAVLEATGKEPTDVNLNDVVQPDALNRLFSHKHDDTARSGGTLTFEFAGCLVTVEGDGEIRVDPNP
ncbi:HalOD1 output domain-containing protein [Haloplanus litoreus]|uniref:HalOD1 output domain-containing protein n=2 Tax=Haloplanus TaxID=376170 RepID=A0ABD5ZUC1_9EURY